MEVFKKIHINITFAYALAQMSNYARFLNKVISKKMKLEQFGTVIKKNVMSFSGRYSLRNQKIRVSSLVLVQLAFLLLLRHYVTLELVSIWCPHQYSKKLGIGEVKLATITLQLANRSITCPRGIIEDIFVKIDKIIFMVEFYSFEMEEDQELPIILS